MKNRYDFSIAFEPMFEHDSRHRWYVLYNGVRIFASAEGEEKLYTQFGSETNEKEAAMYLIGLLKDIFHLRDNEDDNTRIP